MHIPGNYKCWCSWKKNIQNIFCGIAPALGCMRCRMTSHDNWTSMLFPNMVELNVLHEHYIYILYEDNNYFGPDLFYKNPISAEYRITEMFACSQFLPQKTGFTVHCRNIRFIEEQQKKRHVCSSDFKCWSLGNARILFDTGHAKVSLSRYDITPSAREPQHRMYIFQCAAFVFSVQSQEWTHTEEEVEDVASVCG